MSFFLSFFFFISKDSNLFFFPYSIDVFFFYSLFLPLQNSTLESFVGFNHYMQPQHTVYTYILCCFLTDIRKTYITNNGSLYTHITYITSSTTDYIHIYYDTIAFFFSFIIIIIIVKKKREEIRGDNPFFL